MRIPIDRGSNIPIYRQIEQYLRQSIESGVLPVATRLPAARNLADDLEVSRITVENAYASLEADGLVERRAGSGTYVLPGGPLPPLPSGGIPEWPRWQQGLATVPGLFPVAATPRSAATPPHPAPIRFRGFGDPRRFPIDDFSRAIREVIRRDGSAALEFGDPHGYRPLRTTIGHVLSSQGVQAHPDNVLITSGSQQAIGLVTQILLNPGDVILVEAPTYDVALDLFRARRLTLVGCPVDAWGMQTDRLEALLLQHRPRLIYTIPNFQNPAGTCMPLVRRRQLIALADRYSIPILEDDFVGDLRYDGRVQPALKALDPGGRVIYIGTFSKLLMPGLRVGFLLAEGPIYDLLARLKWVNDLATSTLIQRALELYVTVGRYQAHIRRSCQAYRRRRDALVQAIGRYLPATVHMTTPQGGLFGWLQLPPEWSATRLQPYAAAEGVEFAPGTRFFPNQADGEPFVRLNFASR
ncbi:MAG TPA: PLP-dependent aminotransferase family protein, partial [Roseiflexaceae bacterium]|nr:PLP-dependent aminotransferase family protein [Roseiflexaceae bacterium]